QTIITDGITTSNNVILLWTTKPGGVSRLTGFTFQGGSDASLPVVIAKQNKGIVWILGNSGQFRFDHNKVKTTNTCGMQFHGYVRGVADHNEFLLSNFQFGIYVHHESWGNVGATGDNSWAQPTNLGT